MKLAGERIIYLFSVLLAACAFLPNEDKIRAIKVIYVEPNLNIFDGTTNGTDTSIAFIFKYKNIEVYKLNKQFTSLVNNKMTFGKKTNYFVRNLNEPFVYKYSEGEDAGNKLSFDSAFKHEWVVQNKMYQFLINDNKPSLMYSYESKNLDTLKESYYITNNHFPNQSATVYFEYCKSLMNIDFSLGKELDSIKQKKLYKARVILNLNINDTLGKGNKFETYYEIQRVDTFNKQEVIKYIDKYNAEK
jgi:hypothetical protein